MQVSVLRGTDSRPSGDVAREGRALRRKRALRRMGSRRIDRGHRAASAPEA
ncbi:MAG TPA: hypothetical protein VFG97_02865 [Pedococcus sp.]|nr:hypothetical protein [Pedococcus sp.]